MADCPLTARRLQVLRELGDGLTMKQVGRKLGIKPSTVRTHAHQAYRSLGVNSIGQAVARLYGAGWLDPVDDGWDDNRVTPAQRLYLTAFDKLLRSRGEDSSAREHMRHHLRSLYIEAERPMPRDAEDGRRVHDRAMDRLLAVVWSPS